MRHSEIANNLVDINTVGSRTMLRILPPLLNDIIPMCIFDSVSSIDKKNRPHV